MKKSLVFAAVLAASILSAACRKNDPPPAPHANHAEQAIADVYSCPMHPQIEAHAPGKCPICGMALVKRNAPAPAANQAVNAVALSPEQRVTANVKTVRVTLDTHTGELVTTGRVTVDERRTSQVTAYSGGRLEKLFANFTGDTVRRGEAVGTIYSPDLYATQQEYLLALSNRERMRNAGFASARSASNDLVDSTRTRLLLSGMTSGQIATLERTHKPIYATTIVSPVSGVVTRKLAVEQQYVMQGQPLLEVADLSHVWVEADVYEQQLPSVKVGDQVEITTPAVPGRTYTGIVSFIVPVLTGATRTARVRIDIDNRGLALKPDMYANVRIIGAPAPAHIMVPATAVVDRGQSQFVWIETRPGAYEPRQVTTGGRHGEAIVITNGVSDGDNVVVEGAFLLDSEAQLRGGAR
ncbi:MAG: efflux RND transporter periplasmic adaptor subunit [Acidobacteriota bacterium]|nr:efflux RND transporter periplasmic adaptor subunit [Acidobacteriota bacterium]